MGVVVAVPWRLRVRSTSRLALVPACGLCWNGAVEADRKANRVLRRLRTTRWLVLHASLYVVLNAAFVAVWLLERPKLPATVPEAARTDFWPGWTMIVFGLPLGLHAALALARRRRPDRQGPPAPAARGERMLATVLFTDIVGSTERASRIGDRRWSRLLDTHDRVARELVERSGGRLVKSTGDGILATFDSPGAAIRCATALRDRLQEVGVEIRAGLHTGEIQPRGADVGGIAVHVAARVMGAAGDGEVLVSRTVRDLVAGSDVVLEDRGSYALKGIGGDWQLFAVRRQQTREVPQ
jgi:class 3 adenylate cyclase